MASKVTLGIRITHIQGFNVSWITRLYLYGKEVEDNFSLIQRFTCAHLAKAMSRVKAWP